MEQYRQTSIRLDLPLGTGAVNCYLLSTASGFVLVDTGPRRGRRELECALSDAGCEQGALKLIILTHGDFDHTGNCAHLHDCFGAPVAMHRGDVGMLERGDMFWNRESANVAVRALVPVLYRFPRSARMTPDVFVEDGQALGEYGIEAQVVQIPGHSQGSIGILMRDGAFFCGDLLENIEQPAMGSLMDDPEAAAASIDKLRELNTAMVYPGHGQPFSLDQLTGV
jgi:glyoxylase-like metal-dependent hydrolase (beta-lactamase superfamily II)